MQQRPWPIRILAFLFIVAPLTNAILNAHLWNTSFSEYVRILFAQRWNLVVEDLLILPLAGWSIYMMRRWSYFAFLALMGFVLFRNSQFGAHLSRKNQIFYLSLIYAFNSILVAYFLIPAVRAGFFDPRLRWWEALPRYELLIPVTLAGKEGRWEVTSLNASAGGLLLKSALPLPTSEDLFTAEFAYGDSHRFVLPAKVVHRRDAAGAHLIGIQFERLSREQSRSLREFGKKMKRDGLAPLRAPKPLHTELREWFASRLGKGKSSRSA